MTTVRKLLLAVLLVSLAGSAFGAGTFATFNASTTNAGSTFATGTLTLSDKTTDKNNASTVCLSSTTASNTDLNDGTGGGTCGALFTTTLSKPGDSATMDLDLKNEGSLAASTLKGYASSACADSLNTNSNPNSYTGSGSACDQVQLTVQEYTNAGRGTPSTCWYGDTTSGGPGKLTGSTITVNPGAVATPNGTVVLAVDGDPNVTATFNGSVGYKTPAALASALQAAIRAAAGGTAGKTKQVQIGGQYNVGSTTQGTIRIASGKVGAAGSVQVVSGTALSTFGLSAASNTGSAGTTCQNDQAHTLGGFATGTVGFTSTDGLDLGATAAGTTRYLRITVKLPTEAGNDVQGRSATMNFTWRLDQ